MEMIVALDHEIYPLLSHSKKEEMLLAEVISQEHCISTHFISTNSSIERRKRTTEIFVEMLSTIRKVTEGLISASNVFLKVITKHLVILISKDKFSV